MKIIDPNRFMAKVVAGSMMTANMAHEVPLFVRTMTFEVPEGFDIEIGAVWILTKASGLPTGTAHE